MLNLSYQIHQSLQKVLNVFVRTCSYRNLCTFRRKISKNSRVFLFIHMFFQLYLTNFRGLNSPQRRESTSDSIFLLKPTYFSLIYPSCLFQFWQQLVPCQDLSLVEELLHTIKTQSAQCNTWLLRLFKVFQKKFLKIPVVLKLWDKLFLTGYHLFSSSYIALFFLLSVVNIYVSNKIRSSLVEQRAFFHQFQLRCIISYQLKMFSLLILPIIAVV